MNKDLLLKELQELEYINTALRYQLKLNNDRLAEIDQELAAIVENKEGRACKEKEY